MVECQDRPSGNCDVDLSPLGSPALQQSQANIPLMITKKQRASLRALGISDEQIKTMTPQDAHTALGIG